MILPNLASYDRIILNTSGGKDSQTMLDVVMRLAAHHDLLDRVVVVHCDLGELEWEGVPELAEQQARHYDPNVRFEVVRNPGWSDLLERIESRGAWPDAGNRYCTSEFKTGQVKALMTRLVRELRTEWGLPPGGRKGRKARLLNVLGMRADESPARAQLSPFGRDATHWSKVPTAERAGVPHSKREVDRWLPIHDWSLERVWDNIRRSGVPYHWAYDENMPRLSCTFCVFATKSQLIRSTQLRPDLAARYAAAEQRMGHLFRKNFSIAELVEEAARTEAPVEIENWSA